MAYKLARNLIFLLVGLAGTNDSELSQKVWRQFKYVNLFVCGEKKMSAIGVFRDDSNIIATIEAHIVSRPTDFNIVDDANSTSNNSVRTISSSISFGA